MYTASLSFRPLRKVDADTIVRTLFQYLDALQMNGQVLSDEWPMTRSKGIVSVFVSIPERDSLRTSLESKSLRWARGELAAAGLSQPKVTILGAEPTSSSICKCATPNCYILYTYYVSSECPLRCGDCFDVVPYYRIPPTSKTGTYEHIYFWQKNYQFCDTFQMNCGVGERFGMYQISNLNSRLSKDGLECCRQVERVTSKPCFYYLYYYSPRGLNPKRRLQCPKCKRTWLLDERWHDKFDFRCDPCRLLSNLAQN
jgi:predicted  nucleic acid-binding Zn ribbon protein